MHYRLLPGSATTNLRTLPRTDQSANPLVRQGESQLKPQISHIELGDSRLEVQTFGSGKPRILITGGIHGGEATGVYVANRLIATLTEREVKGEVRIIARSNPTAFARLERTSPYDDLDLNRIFPGDPAGTISERTAAALWAEAEQADLVIDLHCCGLWSRSYALAVYGEFSAARELAADLAMPVTIQSGGTRGQMFVEACHKGIPALIIELTGGGQGGIIDLKAAEEGYTAVFGLLQRRGFVAGPAPTARTAFCGKLQSVRVPRDGVFLPAVEAGQRITLGQALGTVDGVVVPSPVDGLAMVMRPASYVFSGTPLLLVAALAE